MCLSSRRQRASACRSLVSDHGRRSLHVLHIELERRAQPDGRARLVDVPRPYSAGRARATHRREDVFLVLKLNRGSAVFVADGVWQDVSVRCDAATSTAPRRGSHVALISADVKAVRRASCAGARDV